LLWFLDDAVPTIGTSTRSPLVISAPDQAITLVEGEPVLRCYPETFGNTLQCVLNLREYVACVTRHAAGTAVVSSAAYTSGLV
jgi:hypothetical protein